MSLWYKVLPPQGSLSTIKTLAPPHTTLAHELTEQLTAVVSLSSS